MKTFEKKLQEIQCVVTQDGVLATDSAAWSANYKSQNPLMCGRAGRRIQQSRILESKDLLSLLQSCGDLIGRRRDSSLLFCRVCQSSLNYKVSSRKSNSKPFGLFKYQLEEGEPFVPLNMKQLGCDVWEHLNHSHHVRKMEAWWCAMARNCKSWFKRITVPGIRGEKCSAHRLSRKEISVKSRAYSTTRMVCSGAKKKPCISDISNSAALKNKFNVCSPHVSRLVTIPIVDQDLQLSGSSSEAPCFGSDSTAGRSVEGSIVGAEGSCGTDPEGGHDDRCLERRDLATGPSTRIPSDTTGHNNTISVRFLGTSNAVEASQITGISSRGDDETRGCSSTTANRRIRSCSNLQVSFGQELADFPQESSTDRIFPVLYCPDTECVLSNAALASDGFMAAAVSGSGESKNVLNYNEDVEEDETVAGDALITPAATAVPLPQLCPFSNDSGGDRSVSSSSSLSQSRASVDGSGGLSEAFRLRRAKRKKWYVPVGSARSLVEAGLFGCVGSSTSLKVSVGGGGCAPPTDMFSLENRSKRRRANLANRDETGNTR